MPNSVFREQLGGVGKKACLSFFEVPGAEISSQRTPLVAIAQFLVKRAKLYLVIQITEKRIDSVVCMGLFSLSNLIIAMFT